MDLASKEFVQVLVEEPVNEQWFKKDSLVCALSLTASTTEMRWLRPPLTGRTYVNVCAFGACAVATHVLR